VNTDYVNAILVSGPPGIGKTWTIDGILDRQRMSDTNPIQYTRSTGKITPLAFFYHLRSNCSPDSVLFFDDADSILHDPNSLNLLKAASERTRQRVIQYNSTQVSEGTVVFEGKIIIATNIEFSKNPHYEAVLDRFHVYNMEISYQEKLAKIWEISEATSEEEDMEKSLEVLKYMLEMEGKINTNKVTIRTFVKLRELRSLMPVGWKRFAELSKTYFAK